MIQKGFIFNSGLCVGCRSCIASCTLENGQDVHRRKVLVRNIGLLPDLPVINLSMACNHCQKPACLKGCPASAFSRDKSTGAVVLKDDKCLGCSYCIWNCPFDAPEINESGVTGKCDLCQSRLKDGLEPACSNSCPTGALSFGPVPGDQLLPRSVAESLMNPDGSQTGNNNNPEWFPGQELGPAFRFTNYPDDRPVRIIPSDLFGDALTHSKGPPMRQYLEWSLITFSFCATLAVALVISSLFGSRPPNHGIIAGLLVFSGVISLFHLGRRRRAWRALANIKSSPLSREIAMFLLFSSFTAAAYVSDYPWLKILASVSGLLFLVSIDAVYSLSDNRYRIRFHPGQVFPAGLTLISLFAGVIWPFVFMASLRLLLSVSNLISDERGSPLFVFKFLRIALLGIATAALVSWSDPRDPFIIALVLAGEIAGRIIYYSDFSPSSLTKTINEKTNNSNYERK